jgi:hypothetical protein
MFVVRIWKKIILCIVLQNLCTHRRVGLCPLYDVQTYTNTKHFGQWQYFYVQVNCHCTNKFSVMILFLHRHNNNKTIK